MTCIDMFICLNIYDLHCLLLHPYQSNNQLVASAFEGREDTSRLSEGWCKWGEHRFFEVGNFNLAFAGCIWVVVQVFCISFMGTSGTINHWFPLIRP